MVDRGPVDGQTLPQPVDGQPALVHAVAPARWAWRRRGRRCAARTRCPARGRLRRCRGSGAPGQPAVGGELERGAVVEEHAVLVGEAARHHRARSRSSRRSRRRACGSATTPLTRPRPRSKTSASARPRAEVVEQHHPLGQGHRAGRPGDHRHSSGMRIANSRNARSSVPTCPPVSTSAAQSASSRAISPRCHAIHRWSPAVPRVGSA